MLYKKTILHLALAIFTGLGLGAQTHASDQKPTMSMNARMWGQSTQSQTSSVYKPGVNGQSGYWERTCTETMQHNGHVSNRSTVTRKYDDGRVEVVKDTKTEPLTSKKASGFNHYNIEKKKYIQGDETKEVTTESWIEGAEKVTKTTTVTTNTKTQARSTQERLTRCPKDASINCTSQDAAQEEKTGSEDAQCSETDQEKAPSSPLVSASSLGTSAQNTTTDDQGNAATIMVNTTDANKITVSKDGGAEALNAASVNQQETNDSKADRNKTEDDAEEDDDDGYENEESEEEEDEDDREEEESEKISKDSVKDTSNSETTKSSTTKNPKKNQEKNNTNAKAQDLLGALPFGDNFFQSFDQDFMVPSPFHTMASNIASMMHHPWW